MTRHVFIFIACFLIGAVVTTIIRTSRHQPYAISADSQPMDPTMSSSMSTSPLPTMAMSPPAVPQTVVPTTAMPMSTSAPTLTPPAVMADKISAAIPVNTICAICGMPVNPALPTALYKGKVIGFGCKTCPPQFAKEPDKFGPAALANRVVEE